MAIFFDPAPLFNWPVELTIPGSSEPGKMVLRIRHKTHEQLQSLLATSLPPDQLRALRLAAADAGVDDPTLLAVMALADFHARGANELNVLTELIDDWPDGPQDEHKNPVPYSPDALAGLLNRYPAAGKEILRQVLRGFTESRLKN